MERKRRIIVFFVVVLVLFAPYVTFLALTDYRAEGGLGYNRLKYRVAWLRQLLTSQAAATHESLARRVAQLLRMSGGPDGCGKMMHESGWMTLCRVSFALNATEAESVPGRAVAVIHGCPAVLPHLLTSLSHRLLPHWDLVLIAFAENTACVQASIESVHSLLQHPVHLWTLDLGPHPFTVMTYNMLMQLPDFYLAFSTSHLLIFQSDTCVCSRSPHSLDTFLHYDYIGAPWARQPAVLGGNGGFSLRFVPAMLRVLANHAHPSLLAEDLYFSVLFSWDPVARMPSSDVGRQFAVESWFYDRPFATHQIQCNFYSDTLLQLAAHCPEIQWFTGNITEQAGAFPMRCDQAEGGDDVLK